MSDKLKTAGLLLFLSLLGWYWVANAVFALRHPWATSTERLVNIVDVMLFRGVRYDDLRPGEGER